jgi:hypothetical protein
MSSRLATTRQPTVAQPPSWCRRCLRSHNGELADGDVGPNAPGATRRAGLALPLVVQGEHPGSWDLPKRLVKPGCRSADNHCARPRDLVNSPFRAVCARDLRALAPDEQQKRHTARPSGCGHTHHAGARSVPTGTQRRRCRLRHGQEAEAPPAPVPLLIPCAAAGVSLASPSRGLTTKSLPRRAGLSSPTQRRPGAKRPTAPISPRCMTACATSARHSGSR